MLPAPAQGILALEIREDDKETEKIIDSIKDDITKIQIDAERGFLIGVNGSCHIPMGAYCEIEGEKITLTGLYGDGEGKKIVVQSQVGTLAETVLFETGDPNISVRLDCLDNEATDGEALIIRAQIAWLSAEMLQDIQARLAAAARRKGFWFQR